MLFPSHKLCLAIRSLTTLTDFSKSGTQFIKNAINTDMNKVKPSYCWFEFSLHEPRKNDLIYLSLTS